VTKKEWSHRALRLWITVSLILMVQSSAVEGWNRLQHNARKIKDIVADLKKQLNINAEITTAVVAEDELLVSVAPVRGRKDAFRISFDATFLAMLDEEELPAAIAHELGHVWIFTHHPYLHTEDLANAIAHRLVSVAEIDRLYEKVRIVKSPPSNLYATMR
jgi:Peptidase family M48